MNHSKVFFKDFISSVSELGGYTKNDTSLFINELKDIIIEGLEKDKKVKIKGLGTFKVKDVEDRTGRHPISGEPILIPAHSKVSFLADSKLNAEINKPYAHLEPEFIENSDKNQTTNTEVKEPRLKSMAEENRNDISFTTEDTSNKEIEDINLQEEVEDIDFKNDPINESISDEVIDEINQISVEETTSDYVSNNLTEEKIFHPTSNTSIYHAQPESSKKYILWGALALLIIIGFFIFKSPNKENTVNETISSTQAPVNVVQKTPVFVEKTIVAPVKIEQKEEIKFKTYKIKSNDNLWDLAKEKLNNPYLWPIIYELNKENINFADMIFTGDSIKIPNLSSSKFKNLTEKEKTILAKGYMSHYKKLKNLNRKDAKNFLNVAQNLDASITSDANLNNNDININQHSMTIVNFNSLAT